MRDRLQAVVEVEHHLVERQLVGDQHAVGRLELQRFLDPALVLAQLQDGADELRRRQHGRGDHRLLDLGDGAGIRQLGRVVDLDGVAVGGGHPVEHARRGGDQVHAELALEPLLDDLHVQQAEEAAAEPEAQRDGGLRLEEERRVVQAQLLERVAQLGILMALHRVEPGEHHRLQFLEARERRQRRPRGLGDRVADLRVGHALDAAGDEAHFTRAEAIYHHRLRREDAELLHFVVLRGVHQQHLAAGADGAFQHADDDDHAAVGVVPGVEDQRLERRRGIALGRRHPRDDRLEDVLDAAALLGAREDRGVAVEADDVLDLPASLVGLRAREIDLVDDRDDLEAVFHRQVGVRQRLRFHALRGIDHQQRALARGERPRHLVAEVHVPRRVDEVQDVGLPVGRRVVQADRVRLDRDATLALQVHAVEHLGFHLASLQRTGDLEEAVSQGRLAVVDVGDDREVADIALYQCGLGRYPFIMAHAAPRK